MQKAVFVGTGFAGVMLGVFATFLLITPGQATHIRSTLPASPDAIQLTGSVVSIDAPNKIITMQTISPYLVEERILIHVTYSDLTLFRSPGSGQTGHFAGSEDTVKSGSRIFAYVSRTPGTLHTDQIVVVSFI